MAEYIERKKLLKDLSEIPAYFDSGDIRYGIEITTAKVKEQPTADVVEVKRGKWEKIKKLFVAVNPYKHTCGLCGKSYFDHNKFNYPYCPNCGADMRGEKNDL